MRRFGASPSVDDVVAQDVEAIGPDRCQNLCGEVMIVATPVKASESNFFYFVAVGRTPYRDGIESDLVSAERDPHVE